MEFKQVVAQRHSVRDFTEQPVSRQDLADEATLTGAEATGEELIRFDLGEDFSIETAVVVGRLYRQGAEWKFNAIGAGYSGGLGALGKAYGVNV